MAAAEADLSAQPWTTTASDKVYAAFADTYKTPDDIVILLSQDNVSFPVPTRARASTRSCQAIRIHVIQQAEMNQSLGRRTLVRDYDFTREFQACDGELDGYCHRAPYDTGPLMIILE